MKAIFRTLLLVCVCVFFLANCAQADNDKPINLSDLPAAAQTLISQYFPDKKVALAKVESSVIEKNYDVIFTDGTKLEFNRKGEWTEINCRKSQVPAGLVPTSIAQYVKSTYPGTQIIKIEHEHKEYEVKLSTGIEITFNKKFQVIDID